MDDIKLALLGDHEAAKLTHLSLFSGIGGLDLAAEMAGFRTVGQCEWANYPTKVLEKHWPDVPRWRDIRTLTGESFYEKTGMRTVDVISGGFPCQPFSVAGKRRGKEDDRYLWPEMLRVISELRPTWVVGENVAGIINMALDTVLADLENEGYEGGAALIPACGVDAPHRRERCAIVGYAKHDGLFASTLARGAAASGGNKPEGSDEAGEPARTGLRGYGATLAYAEGVGCEIDGADGESERGIRFETSPITRICALPNADDGGRTVRRDGQLSAAASPGGVGADNAGGAAEYAGGKRRAAEPRLGGMADGVSDWLERGMSVPGCWLPEPPDIPRITTRKENRRERLKCLGNAVVPQQFYPVFQAIADIERGIVHG